MNFIRLKKALIDVWPKLLIFTIMLLIVIFQKSPEKLKTLGQDDELIKKQMDTGEFITTEYESSIFT